MAQQPLEKRPRKTNDWFGHCSSSVSGWLGSKWAFAAAACVIVLWGALGPVFHYSDTWQLVINTGTTIVTFLMVFLIQSTQNRDAEAVHIKLDELLRISPGAHNVLMDLEELEEAELGRLRAIYCRLADEARRGVSHGRSDEGVPDIHELAG